MTLGNNVKLYLGLQDVKIIRRVGSTKVMPQTFFRKCNCNNDDIYMDDSCIFCNYETIFPHSLHHFQHTFANAE
jgi:hypothetical protein